jgi:hypothetical protein
MSNARNVKVVQELMRHANSRYTLDAATRSDSDLPACAPDIKAVLRKARNSDNWLLPVAIIAEGEFRKVISSYESDMITTRPRFGLRSSALKGLLR